MIVRMFKTEDYYNINFPKGGFDLSKWTTSDARPYLEALEREGTARTIEVKGDIFAIFGLHILWDGVCEVFLFPSVLFCRWPLRACKIIREHLEQIKPLFNRIQFTCLNEPKFIRFSEFFGFDSEGIMRNYDRFKQDYVMSSWIRR